MREARFTQSVRAELEDGSVAFYVGIEVYRPGTYEIYGRIYDGAGRPAVLARFLGDLATTDKEVRLLAFGKVLLDEGAAPPLVLRDLEGRRMVFGQHPDRELMDDWDPQYRSAAFDLSSISPKEYDGPDKRQRIADLDKATRDGLDNIRKGAPPAPPPGPPSPAASH